MVKKTKHGYCCARKGNLVTQTNGKPEQISSLITPTHLLDIYLQTARKCFPNKCMVPITQPEVNISQKFSSTNKKQGTQEKSEYKCLKWESH